MAKITDMARQMLGGVPAEMERERDELWKIVQEEKYRRMAMNAGMGGGYGLEPWQMQTKQAVMKAVPGPFDITLEVLNSDEFNVPLEDVKNMWRITYRHEWILEDSLRTASPSVQRMYLRLEREKAIQRETLFDRTDAVRLKKD